MTMKLAYMMSRFPKLSETFILYEILEMRRLGMAIDIFPLLREQAGVTHPEVQALLPHTHYHPTFSGEMLAAQGYWLRRRPLTLLKSWARVLLGHWRSPAFLLRALVVLPLAGQLAREMQQMGIQHIHVHYATHPLLAAFLIHQYTGIPYSVTAHAHDIYVDRTFLGPKLRDAAAIVTISQYNRDLLTRLYGAEVGERIHVIHCGIDPAVFSPREVQQRGERFTLLCVASLQDYKGQRHLIDACAQLKAQGIPFECLLVGEGELRPDLEAQIASLGLEAEVKLLGGQPRQRVSELLQSVDVMVLPSVITPSGKMEGIPVALMEALAMEVPVVTTRISGIPELISDGETGLLVPPEDPSALAQALLRLYQNPALGRQMGQRGRAKVLAAFNLLENSRQLYALLRGL